MDIKDLRIGRKKLEEKLCGLLRDFENDTGTYIVGLEIFRTDYMGGKTEVVKCSLDLKL